MVSFIGKWNRSALRKPPTCYKPLTNFIEYTSPSAVFELTLVVIGTDCTFSSKSNYHTIMTAMTPIYLVNWLENTTKIKINVCIIFLFYLFICSYTHMGQSKTHTLLYHSDFKLSICHHEKVINDVHTVTCRTSIIQLFCSGNFIETWSVEIILPGISFEIICFSA